MDIRDILSHCDHTLLKQDAVWREIQEIIDDGIKYGVASVCIPPCFVRQAKDYAQDKLRICTVVGFPNGYSSTVVKQFETEQAIRDGADEVDMVINIGDLRDKNFTAVEQEISLLKRIVGSKILKVIIETCLLTDQEKAKMAKIVSSVGADYIKTSTGFSKGGATLSDIAIFKENIFGNVKIKAAGGIRTIEDAQAFLLAGCDRLGTSAIVKIVKSNI